MYLNPISVLLLCKYTYLPVLLSHKRFRNACKMLHFPVPFFSCVRRLLQEYKIHTLITWYFLKQFFFGGGKLLLMRNKEKTRQGLDKTNCRIIVRIFRNIYGIIFVGIVVIFCIADSFGLASYLHLAKVLILKTDCFYFKKVLVPSCKSSIVYFLEMLREKTPLL